MSKATIIRRLLKADQDGKDTEKLENVVASLISEYASDPVFYTLPLRVVLRIVPKCTNIDIQTATKLIGGAANAYGSDGFKVAECLPNITAQNDEPKPHKLRKMGSSQCVDEILAPRPKLTKERTKIIRLPRPHRKSDLTCFEDIDSPKHTVRKRVKKVAEEPKKEEPKEELDLNENPFSMVENGHFAALKQIIKENPGLVKETDSSGNTLLHIAAKYGQKEIICFLIDNGADLEKRNRKLWTPLHYAAGERDVSVVELLLEKGATVEPYGKDSPLHIAVYNDRVEIAELLLDHGADINKRGFTLGFVPLGYAKSQRMIQLLTEYAE